MAGFDYDVVIIGSGFGGSVAALRAAEKGYRVGVVESGRRWADEDIPKTQEMAHEGVPLVVIQRQLGHATSASPTSISRRSTAARSSAPSTAGPRRQSRPTPASR
jgi:choline dehydrogenase-like flavoprotein